MLLALFGGFAGVWNNQGGGAVGAINADILNYWLKKLEDTKSKAVPNKVKELVSAVESLNISIEKPDGIKNIETPTVIDYKAYEFLLNQINIAIENTRNKLIRYNEYLLNEEDEIAILLSIV